MTIFHDDRPIGLFDSGIGGLTVLRSLLSAFPGESFAYLGDTARLPYGSKSPQTIDRYLRQNIEFLTRAGVKAIVVACNSASTVLLDRTHDFAVPIYNVIEPGARAAIRASQSKSIGVLGTRATVSAGAYVRALQAIDPAARAFQQACPLLVPLVEEGWEAERVTEEIVARYLAPLLAAGPAIDTLILGCTHYPVLKEIISRTAGAGVRLVDSAEAVGESIAGDFASGRIARARGKPPSFKVMTTDTSAGFLEVARRLLGPDKLSELVEVDLV